MLCTHFLKEWKFGDIIYIHFCINLDFQTCFFLPSGYLRRTASPPGYRISWEEFNRTNTRVTHYLPNLTQEYKVTGLTALTTYTIQVAAMTAKGQGQLSASTISSGVPPGQTETLRRLNSELIQTASKISPFHSLRFKDLFFFFFCRSDVKGYFALAFHIPSATELPGPPTNLAVSNIGPRSVALQFKPGYDGKTSISRWQVEAQVRQLIFSSCFLGDCFCGGGSGSGSG